MAAWAAALKKGAAAFIFALSTSERSGKRGSARPPLLLNGA